MPLTKFYIAILAIVCLATAMLTPIHGMAQSPRNLLAYWKFNGDYKDATGNGHDGRKKGNVKFAKSKAPVPDAGEAVEFAGQAGNAVEIRDSDGLRLTDELSLMAWVNPVDAAPTQFCCGVPYDTGGNWDNPWVGHQIGVRGGKMATWLTLDGKAPAPPDDKAADPMATMPIGNMTPARSFLGSGLTLHSFSPEKRRFLM